MKSPDDLRCILRKQWEDANHRQRRLLGHQDVWPIVLSIGSPSPALLTSQLHVVKQHIQAWRDVGVGEVVWEDKRYRATGEKVRVPVRWKIDKPSVWIDACGDSAVRGEYQSLAKLIEHSDPMFHSLLIRRRALWRDKPIDEVITAGKLAMQLGPGDADGRPLRLLSLEGIDTKFFERNGGLIRSLLDVRFDSEPSRLGLETFLGAPDESDNWLLVVDLDGGLLPFDRQRVRASELCGCRLPGHHLIVVENETCSHLLPAAADTLAILGAGFDLGWLTNKSLTEKRVAYWGDIDTWGLSFLAKARSLLPDIQALMMTPDVFEQHHHCAVNEPVLADAKLPQELQPAETSLYERLLTEPRGRLEQEFLPTDIVHQAVRSWIDSPR
ncbi:Wadjet anti-phage system protein JetD domain-containing protein [Crateriforma conspicua]|uniref:Wadjet protein JetD C-terminal domain-containing protein n=1 Tax=Crateriforma conspicua TaxID=2527996 RepID=A0A5C6FTN1_9PLAN|nr:Wadjet anti-phage system protein JetD domain-containing protein [Crateriforma conspicua]TWU64543.1 hypothetical protein V7x_00870 [Crateriforma conspicua]